MTCSACVAQGGALWGDHPFQSSILVGLNLFHSVLYSIKAPTFFSQM
jgi:hypothetical protein